MEVAQLNFTLVMLVAAAAAWTGDDWCPTPPRPPWPWPWIVRKLIAVIGGCGFVFVAYRAHGPGGNWADLLAIAVIGMVGGTALASLVNYLASSGPRSGNG